MKSCCGSASMPNGRKSSRRATLRPNTSIPSTEVRRYISSAPPFLEASFREKGIPLTDGSEADIVVSSFDTTLTYEKLEKACTLIRNGAKFYSTHPDFNCPTETGFIPDSGAICALITASTGKQPRYFGKPHKETAEMLSRRFGIPAEKTAVVGDRLYTDIALGRNNGLTSILVLTGETKREDVNESNAPDFIFDSIGEISRFF